jgi:signal transduction histidine kinase
MSTNNDVSSTPLKRVFGKKKQLEQNLSYVTQEMYRRNKELAETNQVLSILRKIDTIVLESQESIQDMANEICRLITTETDYPFVTILGESERHKHTLETYGWSQKNTLFDEQLNEALHEIKINSSSAWFSNEPRTQLVQSQLFDKKEIANFLGCHVPTARLIRDKLPLKSLFLVKLVARQKITGLMVIGFLNATTAEQHIDSLLLNRLSEAVGIAVDNKLLLDENVKVLKQLQHSNEKLKAMDETKDEFISMASHQLRTPLTSVKGYLSMVLEGDAGELNEMQQKLLSQAFTSSQRMVYLIADLLNVSRLKTGKFIIERHPTNLAEVVEGEIAQLIETAKARDLELTFKKPETFTSIMLDEVKIRQVIMNFTDNAIYYTPAGGHIKVALKETKDSIEFTVTDDGMGVPKSEQPHLFTKFYRAGNARKARPDGTGLGLFMAKKVIVAQGGALVFKSQEGKGSTFGFNFSKDKHKIPEITESAAK